MNEFENFESESFADELDEFSGEMEDEVRRGMPPRSRAGSRSPRRPAPRMRRPGPMRVRSRPPLRPRRPGFRPGFIGGVSYTADPVASAGPASERVRWAQDCLNRAMSTQLPVDGVMTAAARSAVRSFQKQHGLNVTGILGPDTEEALKRACAGSAQPAAAADSAPSGDAPADAPAADASGDDGEFGFEAEGELGNVVSRSGSANGSRIIDLTGQTDQNLWPRRDPKSVYALVLHQMGCCFRPRDPLKRFLKLKAHFAILPDGRILQLHPVAARISASGGFNSGSVAVEFAGNFPSVRGKWWRGETFGRNQPTDQQIDSGRYLIRYLKWKIGLTHVLAHRQSSGTRANDPGPEIWYHVGQWAIDNVGMQNGPPGFKIRTGNPIPDEWRTWGRRSVVRETNPMLEAEQSESEIAHDELEVALVGERASLDEAEVDVAMRQALAQFPPRDRPEYVSQGKLAEAIGKVSGAGLYLIRFRVNGKEMAYHGMATDLRTRLMQHRRCAQMLGLSIEEHTVSTASLPSNVPPRTRERPINAYLRRHHRPWFTNQRTEVEEAALAEIST